MQATDGQWRTSADWPAVDGPQRRLLLGPGGTLGADSPSGSTTYLEGPVPELEAPPLPGAVAPAAAVFETAPVAEDLEVIGMPRLDLWVRLAVPDAHLTARLEVIGTDGQRLVAAARTMGPGPRSISTRLRRHHVDGPR
ncbi:MAG: CocE/NonD family hydrolase C-terminal non-catalytic domain-containing protein, partial [Acidimicrobiales bacterium]